MTFVYQREYINKVKSESFAISVKSRRRQGPIAVYSKEDVIQALLDEDIREEAYRIKFWSSLVESWESLRNELYVNLDSGATQSTFPNDRL